MRIEVHLRPLRPIRVRVSVGGVIGVEIFVFGEEWWCELEPLVDWGGGRGGISLVYFDLTGRGGDFLKGPGVF